MRKVQTCIGLDMENLEWLRGRQEGVSAFLNGMVTIFREQDPESRKEVEPESEMGKLKELNEKEKEERSQLEKQRKELSDIAKARAEEKSACIEAIRDSILKDPKTWLVPVKKNIKNFNRGHIIRIMNSVRLECDTKPTISDVEDVFLEEFKKFDFEKYKKQLQKEGVKGDLMQGW